MQKSSDVQSELISVAAVSSNAMIHLSLAVSDPKVNQTHLIHLNPGEVNNIKVQVGENIGYEVLKRTEEGDDELQGDVIAIKHGDDLRLIYVDGTVVVIEGFYTVSSVDPDASTFLTLPGETSEYEYSIHSQWIDENSISLDESRRLLYAQGDRSTSLKVGKGYEDLAEVLEQYTPPSTAECGFALVAPFGLLGPFAAINGGLGFGLGGVVSNLMRGFISLGPVIKGNGLSVQAYQADGTLINAGQVQDDGTFSIDLAHYRGIVILKVMDDNADADYLDAATGAPINGDTILIAVVDTSNGIPKNTTITILTTVAAQQAGVEANGDVSGTLDANTVNDANKDVAIAFGLINTNIIHDIPVAVINADGSMNANANDYGKVLAALSGMTQSTSGVSQTITILKEGLTQSDGTPRLNTATQTAVLDGAQQAELSNNNININSLITNTAITIATSDTSLTAAVKLGFQDTGLSSTDDIVSAYDLDGAGNGTAIGIEIAVSGVTGVDWEYSTDGGTTWTQGTAEHSFALGIGIHNQNDIMVRSPASSGATVTLGSTGKVQVDATIPTAILSSNIAPDANLTMTFAEPVTAVSGKYINIYDSNHQLIEQISVTDPSIIILNGNIVDINPTNDFGINVDYYVQIDAGAFVDAASNAYAGVSNLSDWGFTAINPSTSVIWSDGTNDVSSKGINATEWGQLEITGAITNMSSSAVTGIAMTSITFVAQSLGGSNVAVDNNKIPSLINTNGVKTWTLAHADVPTLAEGETYTIEVVLSASSGTTTSYNPIPVLIDITAPVFPGGASTTVDIDEHSATSVVVYDAQAMDNNGTPDASITYALTGADSNAFNIDTTTGKAKLIASPDYESKPSYFINVEATDVAGNATIQSVDVNVNNVDDTGSIAISGTATQGQTLTAGSISDGDGGVTNVTYQWQADGMDIGANSDTYLLTQAEVGKTIEVIATYDDNLGSYKTVTSAKTNAVVDIEDLGSMATISGMATQGQTLTAGSISDDDGITNVSYQWQADGVDIGANSDTYVLTQTEVGKTIEVIATYDDGFDGTSKTVISVRTATVIDEIPPIVTNLVISSDAGDDNTYKVGDTIAITVTMSEVVTVAGTPRIAFNIGGSVHYASYASGSNSSELIFRYIVVNGNTDSDGIAIVANALEFSGGTITDVSSNTADITHRALSDSGSNKVDTTLPTIEIDVTNNVTTLKAGETATINFTLSEPSADFDLSDIAVSGGTLGVLSGTGSSYSAIFSPTSNSTADGVVSVASDTFTDAAGNRNADGAESDNVATMTVDTEQPTVSSYSGNIAPDGNPIITFAEVVQKGTVGNIRIYDNTNPANPQKVEDIAVISSQITITNQRTITIDSANSFTQDHNYYVQIDAGAFVDMAGNAYAGISNTSDWAFTAINPSTDAVWSDGTSDVSSSGISSSEYSSLSITGTITNINNAAKNIAIDGIIFKAQSIGGADVAVASGDIPTLVNDIDGTSWSVANVPPLVEGEMYTIEVVLSAADGVGGTFITTSTNTTPVLIDTSAPSISDVSINATDRLDIPKNDTLVEGDKIVVTVTMSETTIVTGMPTYTIDVGGNPIVASYVSGSGTNTLTFSYTIADGDTYSGDITAGTSALDLSGGAMSDGVENNVENNLSSPTPTVNNNNIDVDASKPDDVDLKLAIAGIQATSSMDVNKVQIAAGVAFFVDIAAPNATDIQEVKIVLAGSTLDHANDKLVLDAELNLDADSYVSNIVLGSITGIDYQYTHTDNTLLISQNNLSNFTTADIKLIVEAIKLKNTQAIPSDGERSALISYIDTAGNEGASATATIDVHAPPTIASISDSQTTDVVTDSKVTYTITFSHELDALTSSDIKLIDAAGSLIDTTNWIIAPTTLDGTTWTVDVTPPSGTNAINTTEVRLKIEAGSITDIYGNTNNDLIQTSSSERFNTVTPQAADSDAVIGDDLNDVIGYDDGDTITIRFNEPIDISNIILGNLQLSDSHTFGTSGNGASVTAIDDVSGYATTFEITLGSDSTFHINDTITLGRADAVDVNNNLASEDIVFIVPIPNSGPTAAVTNSINVNDANTDGQYGQGDIIVVNFSTDVVSANLNDIADFVVVGKPLAFGAGASVSAVGDGVNASGFQITLGAGATVVQGDQITIAASDVIDTNVPPRTAANDIGFILTDITPPAITSVNSIVAVDVDTAVENKYDATDKLIIRFNDAVNIANLTMDVENAFSVNNTKTLGDNFSVATIGGVDGFSTQFEITLGATTTIVAGDTLSVNKGRVEDRSANRPAADLQFTIPSIVPPEADPIKPITVGETNDRIAGVYDVGDTITLKFNRPVSTSLSLGDLSVSGKHFGVEATLTAVAPIDNFATEFKLTLGADTDVVQGDQISIYGTQVLDLGNTSADGNVVFTLPDITPPVASGNAVPNAANNDDLYSAGDTLTINFSEGVRVSEIQNTDLLRTATDVGTATITLNNGHYFGSDATIVATNADSDGYATQFRITLAGIAQAPTVATNDTITVATNKLTDAVDNTQVLDQKFTVPMANIQTITDIVIADGTYGEGDTIDVTIYFSERLHLDEQTHFWGDAIASIKLDIGGTEVLATYTGENWAAGPAVVPGLFFSYQLLSELDNDGISVVANSFTLGETKATFRFNDVNDNDNIERTHGEQHYPNVTVDAPFSIASNVSIWLDAQDVDGDGDITDQNDGDKISTWIDKSGRHHAHAVSTNANEQATIDVDGLNGKTTVRFDRTDGGDRYRIFDSAYHIKPQIYDMFVVTERMSSQAWGNVLLAKDGEEIQGWQLRQFGRYLDRYVYTVRGTTGSDHGTQLRDIDGAVLISAGYDGTDRYINADGVEKTVREPNAELFYGLGSSSIYEMTLGYREHHGNPEGDLDANVSEILFFERSLSDAATKIVQNYLSAKWGTNLASSMNYYAGDTKANGDYDFGVAGILKLSDSSVASNKQDALTIRDMGYLKNVGDAIFAGNKGLGSSTADLPNGIANVRSDTVWYLDVRDTAILGGKIGLDFDLAKLGLENTVGLDIPDDDKGGHDDYTLLWRSSQAGQFYQIAVADSIDGDTVRFDNIEVDTAAVAGLIETSEDLINNGYFTVGVREKIVNIGFAPRIQSTVADGNAVTLTYDEYLDSAWVPYFTEWDKIIVEVGETVMDRREVSGISIDGRNLEVTFDGAPISNTDMVKLYNSDLITGIAKDVAGNDVLWLTGISHIIGTSENSEITGIAAMVPGDPNFNPTSHFNTFRSSPGNDTFTGNGGQDLYLYSKNAIRGNDTITDFGIGATLAGHHPRLTAVQDNDLDKILLSDFLEDYDSTMDANNFVTVVPDPSEETLTLHVNANGDGDTNYDLIITLTGIRIDLAINTSILDDLIADNSLSLLPV